MSKKELLSQVLDQASEQEASAVLDYLEALRRHQSGEAGTALLAESALAKDWLTPEEDIAWADL